MQNENCLGEIGTESYVANPNRWLVYVAVAALSIVIGILIKAFIVDVLELPESYLGDGTRAVARQDVMVDAYTDYAAARYWARELQTQALNGEDLHQTPTLRVTIPELVLRSCAPMPGPGFMEAILTSLYVSVGILFCANMAEMWIEPFKKINWCILAIGIGTVLYASGMSGLVEMPEVIYTDGQMYQEMSASVRQEPEVSWLLNETGNAEGLLNSYIDAIKANDREKIEWCLDLGVSEYIENDVVLDKLRQRYEPPRVDITGRQVNTGAIFAPFFGG